MNDTLTIHDDLTETEGPAVAAPAEAAATYQLSAPTPKRGFWSALEPWRMALAYIAAVLTPVIAYVGNLGFAPLVALLGIGALVFMGRRGAPSAALGILLALLIWALVSMTWSPATPVHPDLHRYKTIESITGMKLVFELAFYGAFVTAMRGVSNEVAARASLFLAIGLSIMAVLLVIESADGAILYQSIKAAMHNKARPDLATRNVARACYVAAVLFWPVVLRLRQAHLPLVIAAFVGGLCISAFVFRVDSPIMALVLGSVVFVAVRRFGVAAIWTLLAGTVVYFAAAPLVAGVVTHMLRPHELPGQVGKLSWAVRLDIWRFVSAEILQNPLRGWGLDASRSWPRDIPLHPHDAALQLWLELGVIGAALAALFWAFLFGRIANLLATDRTMAAASAATAVAYLTIGALSFGVWQEWWLAVGALAVVTCGLVGAARRLLPEDGQELTELTPI